MVKRVLFWINLGVLLAACAGTPSGPPLNDEEQIGRRLFTKHCASCHATSPDTVIVGPSLAGIFERAETRVEGQDAQAYITNSILDPAAYMNEGYKDIMPKTFGTILTGEELDALVAYLHTLK